MPSTSRGATRWSPSCGSAHPIVTSAISIAAGTVCAHRWQLQGVVADRPVVSVEYLATLTADVPSPVGWPTLPEGVEGGGLVYKVKGRPSYQMMYRTDRSPDETVNPSIAMTARAAVNAMSMVVAASPGHLAVGGLGYFRPAPQLRPDART